MIHSIKFNPSVKRETKKQVGLHQFLSVKRGRLSCFFNPKNKIALTLLQNTENQDAFFTVLPQYITIAKPQPKTMLTNFSKLNLWFSVVSKMIVVEICKNIPTTIAKIT